MPKRGISTSSPKDFEPKRKNPISLGSDSNLDNDLKSLKIGDVSTGLEFSLDTISSNVENFVTLKEKTEQLTVTSIRGNKSAGFATPQFIMQNNEATDTSVGLWFNIFTNGNTFLRAQGTGLTTLTLEAVASIYNICGDDPSYGFTWYKGTFTDGSTPTPIATLQSAGQLKLAENASAASDTTAFGQIWVKNATPNELYFTTDAGDDIQLTSGTSAAGGGGSSEYYMQTSGRARCQYNNWYYAVHTTYGGNYYYWFYTTSSATLPSAYADSLAPDYLVPKAGNVTGFTIVGNISSTDTVEWALMKGAQPTYGSAGDFSLSQVGATQSAGGSSNILYKWEQTGLSVSVAKNDILMPLFRRTTDNDATYVYIECSIHITIEGS